MFVRFTLIGLLMGIGLGFGAAYPVSAHEVASPRPWPMMTPARTQAARAVIRGFSEAAVRRDARTARIFLGATFARRCGAIKSVGAGHYLRCLLVDTPLPTGYHIRAIEYATLAQSDLDALVDFRLANTHHQPLWFALRPSGNRYVIISIGLPRG